MSERERLSAAEHALREIDEALHGYITMSRPGYEFASRKIGRARRAVAAYFAGQHAA